MATRGYIYFATNPSMPELIKVGMSTRHPRVRLAELSMSTACPTPFELIAFFAVDNPAKVEAAIHADMDIFRVNERREFFDVPYAELQYQVSQWADESKGCVVTFELDRLADIEFHSAGTPARMAALS